MLEELKGKRLAILGIGNRIRGDDAVGSLLAGELQSNENSLVIDCETVPENFLSKVTEFKPEVILLIDAVEFGAEPGSVKLIEIEDSGPGTVSTHKISVQQLGAVLKKETQARVYLLCIQPKNIEFDAEMSEEVKGAKERIRKELNYLTTSLFLS